MNALGKGDAASADPIATTDYTYEDCRRVISAPPADREGMGAQMTSFFQIGHGTPVFSVEEIIDTRGERPALARTQITYDQGFSIDMLLMVLIDASLERFQRTISFQTTEREAAVRELAETHAAGSACSRGTGGSVATKLSAEFERSSNTTPR